MITHEVKRILSRVLLITGASIATFAVPAIASAATLSLSPTSGTHAVGATFDVKIQLDTGGVTTSGTDVYVRFDPNVLQVVDSNNSSTGVQVSPGTLYSQTSFNSTDNGAGKVSFSGSKSGGSSGYSGTGTLATIKFQAAAEADSTSVTIDYQAGSTTDSNVISQADSSDALTSVTSASYKISAAAGSATAAPTTTTTATTADDTDGDGIKNNADSDADGNGVNDASEGKGGSGSVQGTGLDLSGYMLLTLLSLIGAGYFLTRKPKRT